MDKFVKDLVPKFKTVTDEVKEKMVNTLAPYEKEITKNNTINIFQSFNNKRIETIKMALDKLKEEELV